MMSRMITIENIPDIEVQSLTIPNKELVKAILAMPENEYFEIFRGIFVKERISTDNLMRVFAMCWKQLSHSQLNPAQENALKMFVSNMIKYFKIEEK
jgi:hypothetical protein